MSGTSSGEPGARGPRAGRRGRAALPHARRGAGALALGVALALVAVTAGCTSCPPAWVATPPQEEGFVYGVGRAGRVFVEADRRALALTRAAREVADRLGLPEPVRLSVTEHEGVVFVELVTAAGPAPDLDALQVVATVRCGEVLFALVRLPLPA